MTRIQWACLLFLLYSQHPLSAVEQCNLFNDLAPKWEKPYYGGQEPLEEREDFWSYHPRFGFLNEGRSIALVAKDPKIAEEISGELLNGNSRRPREISISDVTGVKLDVTTLVSPLMKSLHHEFAMGDGPNCWNLCLVNGQLTNAISFTNSREFQFWMHSPLSTPINRVTDLRDGDVLAYRNNKDGKLLEVHGAIFRSPNVTYSKNGTHESRVFRIQDLHEMHNQWAPMSTDVNAFRVIPLVDYLREHRTELPPLLVEKITEMRAIEQLANDYHSPLSEGTVQNKMEFRRRAKSLAEFAETQISSHPEGSPAWVLWRGLKERGDSIRGIVTEDY